MKRLRSLAFLAVVTGLAYNCKKPLEGFISDNIFYRANPFEAAQGIVSYSAPLEVDGSTAPISVKLLDIRDKSTGKSVMDSLLKEKEVTTFVGEVTAADTTVAALEKKLAKSMVKPFNINPVGGRIELTSATSYIKSGSFEFDIEVTNVRGTRIIKNACDVVLAPSNDPYEWNYRRIQTAEPGTTAPLTFITDNSSGFPIDVKYTAGAVNKIILKWVDKNGKPFNPKTDMARWVPDFPMFKDWNPYYPEVATDSTLEYKFPKTGLGFPIIKSIVTAGTPWVNDFGLSYYRILPAATDINKIIRLTHALKYRSDGLYEVTFHINIAAKK